MIALVDRTTLAVCLFIAMWIIGGNGIVAFHHLRVEKPWRSGFNPFLEFNALEWFLTLLVLVAALFVGQLVYRAG
jgi:hypothetical protein